ncbi:MAG: hypothetical protein ACRD3W_13460, partial [Terriglobales bacterium]
MKLLDQATQGKVSEQSALAAVQAVDPAALKNLQLNEQSQSGSTQNAQLENAITQDLKNNNLPALQITDANQKPFQPQLTEAAQPVVQPPTTDGGQPTIQSLTTDANQPAVQPPTTDAAQIPAQAKPQQPPPELSHATVSQT